MATAPVTVMNIATMEAMLAAMPAESPYLYVETGRYKPWSEATVRAARRRGYLCDRRFTGLWHVYPKSAETTCNVFRELHECATRMVDQGTRLPTRDCDEHYRRICALTAKATTGKLRTALGDILASQGVPCVKSERILAALAEYEARRAAAA